MVRRLDCMTKRRLPADLGPLGLGQRGGQHDLGVDGQDLPAVLGQGGQVGLPRQHDDVRGDVAAGRVQHRLGGQVVAGDRGLLVDGGPEGLDGPGQAPDEATGVDGGERLGGQGGPRVVDLDQLGGLPRLQPAVEVRVAELGHLVVDVAQGLHLVAAPGQHQHPVAVEVGVDPVALEGGLDVADGVDQGVVGGPGRVLAVTGDHLGVAHRDLR